MQTNRAHARPIRQVYRSVNKGLRILIADDDHEIADGIANLLELHGYDVIVAYDGQQALELARINKPDVLLLDIDMPEKSGWEVARAVRATQWGQQSSVIANSGKYAPGDVDVSVSSSFDRFLTKPSSVAEILRAVAENR